MDFKLDDAGLWTATVILPSWSAYLNRSATDGELAAGSARGGSVALVFAPEGRDTGPITSHELALIAWAIENERAVSEALRTCVFDRYADVLTPAPADNPGSTIRLRTVYVHQVDRGGIPYIGFEFDYPRNVEHGLGVLMHGTRCVEVGEADTAMLLWVAERDAEAN